MKIKLDENVSGRIVEALRNLESDTSVEIGWVRDDYGAGRTDPDWMFRFKDEGGNAMISGDHNILQKKVNLVAYTESGLISIWPAKGWPELKRWGQAAMLIRWWPAIKMRIAQSDPGDRWRLGIGWAAGVDQFEPIRDPRLDKG